MLSQSLRQLWCSTHCLWLTPAPWADPWPASSCPGHWALPCSPPLPLASAFDETIPNNQLSQGLCASHVLLLLNHHICTNNLCDRDSKNSYHQTDHYLYIKFDEVITVQSDSTFKLRESFFYIVDNIIFSPRSPHFLLRKSGSYVSGPGHSSFLGNWRVVGLISSPLLLGTLLASNTKSFTEP